MIKRFACIAADALPVQGSARKQQRRAGGGVTAKHRKHAALILVVEMEEAVPSDNSVKAAAKRQRSHIVHKPDLARMSSAAQRDHSRRAVDTGKGKAPSDQMAGHRLRAAAPHVEDVAAGRQQRSKALEPFLFD